jgi:hypothetical protein
MARDVFFQDPTNHLLSINTGRGALMAEKYTKKEREQIKKKFSKMRRMGHSIKKSAKAAGVSPSTLYNWCWSKDCEWSKR